MFNEAARLSAVLAGLTRAGFKHVVVVDDGSSDTSASLAALSQVTVISHVINRGQGAALQTGTAYALKNGAKQVVHFDGDDQFNSADIVTALRLMEKNNWDVILGSRFLDQRSRLPFTKKYFILPLSRIVMYVFTGLWLTDGQNGFRIFSRAAAEAVTITHDGMAHNLEIVSEIRKHHLRVGECPVEVRYHRYGQGLRGGVKILRDLLLSHWL